MKLTDCECLIWDNGLFVSMAETLAPSFAKVYYYSEWPGPFPKDSEVAIGTGLAGVTRCDDPWKVIQAADKDKFLIVFPDVYQGGLQVFLRDLGYRVWGGARAEKIENDRMWAKKYMASQGIPVGEWRDVTGTAALREALKTEGDCFVKARYGKMRGNFETFRAESFNLIEGRLDQIEAELGMRKETTQFLIEKPIAPAVEIATDTYCIDGQFPTRCAVGIEIKSKAYVSRMATYADLPSQLTTINEALTPWLKRQNYRNFFAVETRIDEDGTPWAIDPCCRAGRPPSELLQILYTNLAEIFWRGAEGVCIDPKPAAAWGAEIMIYCDRAEKHGAVLEFSKDVAPYVKMVNAAKIRGRNIVLPGLAGIGAVVATGRTMKEAIDTCKERAAEVKGYEVELYPDALDDATAEFAKLKEFGVVIE